MQVSFATEAGNPGIENEDFVGTSITTVVVLDGVTPVDRTDTGCRHGVAWYARTVGSHLLAAATTFPQRGLADCLADAIATSRRRHEHTCDLEHYDGPAATVAAVRVNGDSADSADYLVLADCTLVVDTSDGTEPRVLTDTRPGDIHRALPERLAAPSYRAAYRNRPDGYWVAAQDPAAAGEAFTGTIDGVRRVIATSDGASRLVDLFDQLTWPAALDAIGRSGPAEWIARTRTYERELSDIGSAPPKPHDDATVVLLTEVGREAR